MNMSLGAIRAGLVGLGRRHSLPTNSTVEWREGLLEDQGGDSLNTSGKSGSSESQWVQENEKMSLHLLLGTHLALPPVLG